MPELLHFPLPPAYCTSFDNLQIYAMIVLWNNMKHPEYTFFVKQYKNGEYDMASMRDVAVSYTHLDVYKRQAR